MCGMILFRYDNATRLIHHNTSLTLALEHIKVMGNSMIFFSLRPSDLITTLDNFCPCFVRFRRTYVLNNKRYNDNLLITFFSFPNYPNTKKINKKLSTMILFPFCSFKGFYKKLWENVLFYFRRKELHLITLTTTELFDNPDYY